MGTVYVQAHLLLRMGTFYSWCITVPLGLNRFFKKGKGWLLPSGVVLFWMRHGAVLLKSVPRVGIGSGDFSLCAGFIQCITVPFGPDRFSRSGQGLGALSLCAWFIP